jgi:hypothetical protein
MPLPWVYHLQDGYDLGDLTDDLQGAGEAIVAALTLQDDQRAIAGAPWQLWGCGAVGRGSTAAVRGGSRRPGRRCPHCYVLGPVCNRC